MSARWFFSTDGGTVHLMARFEGEDGMIGDAHRELKPGMSFRGIPHAELMKAGAGVVEIGEDGEAEIK